MIKIPRDSKILSISHNDFDGATCSIILANVYKNITFLPTSFYKIDEILLSLNFDKYDFVFLTDIHPDNSALIHLSQKIILIDHHATSLDCNNPSQMKFVISGDVCAAVLVKRFVEKLYGIELNHLNNLVYLCNDYDMWFLKNPKSKLLNDLMFYFYRPFKFIEKFKGGRTRLTHQEILWLRDRRIKFNGIYENLKVSEFSKINGCITQSEEFINEIAEKLYKEEKYDVVIIRNPVNNRCSIRSHIEGLDTGDILKKHGWGGGHAKSSGLFTNSAQDFEYKVKILEEEIASIIKDLPK